VFSNSKAFCSPCLDHGLDYVTMNESYQYQRLGTPAAIRLLEVLPDLVSECIACKIHHFDEANTPTPGYYALSYLWGNPSPTRTLRLVDRHGDTHSHPLHENLWRFLNHVWQQKMFGRFYWTDSLCLNQEDVDEIAQQVPRMGEIYSAAEEVLIWLGHEQPGEEAMKLVRDWPGPVDWQLVDIGNEEERERAESVDGMFSEVRKAALHLLLLPYWSRVWIVQEVVLARKALVAYGTASLGLDEFRSKVNLFRRETPEFDYQPTIWSLSELRENGGKKPLWELTMDFDLCASSRTIDKVYGFLGLVADLHDGISPAKFIEVNYDKRPFEVFWDTAFECQAPWDQYPRVLLSLGHMLWEHGEERVDSDFRTLEKYAQGVRTSERHARFANLALRVFDAANIIMPIAADFREWIKAIDGLLSSTTWTPSEFTEFQNAAAIGLALTARRSEMHSKWKGHRKLGSVDKMSASSQWRCTAHQAAEGDRGLAVKNDWRRCPKSPIRFDRSALKRVCGKPSPSCDGSMMIFEIQDINFRLVILSDIGDAVGGEQSSLTFGQTTTSLHMPKRNEKNLAL